MRVFIYDYRAIPFIKRSHQDDPNFRHPVQVGWIPDGTQSGRLFIFTKAQQLDVMDEMPSSAVESAREDSQNTALIYVDNYGLTDDAVSELINPDADVLISNARKQLAYYLNGGLNPGGKQPRPEDVMEQNPSP